jgi:hypothetical protein
MTFEKVSKFNENEVFLMTRTDWENNINNLTKSVALKYGADVASSVFKRFDATCFDDLSPTFYDEVFGDLMQIDEDS